MTLTNNHLVIMAGGVGSRFWPMSTHECPKQFIDVLGVGRSLLQLTYDRFKTIVPPENVWIVTNANYTELVEKQLPEVPKENVLSEPCRRNTAPCIAYVSWRIKKLNAKANIVVTPSDHIVTNPEEFRRVVVNCLQFTAETDAIVTLGIKPNRPETGYGYIQADLTTSSARNREIFRVDQFRVFFFNPSRFNNPIGSQSPNNQGRTVPGKAKSRNGRTLHKTEQLLLECRYIRVERIDNRECLQNLRARYCTDF